VGIACLQVLLALDGGWTKRHSLSLPIFIVAAIVLDPVMSRRVPLFGNVADVLRSWRTYLGISLFAIFNIIELNN
jgi:hypothetical protein